MTPEKQSRVTILGPGVVATSFRDPEVIPNGAVAWSGDRIIATGTADEIASAYPEADTIDARGGLILPGLVNLHHHFYSSLARGLNPGRELGNFGEILDGLWWRLDRALDPDAIRISAALAAADSIRWGATTVFDHHASPTSIRGSLQNIASVINDAGLSAVLCYEITDRNGHPAAVEGINENIDFFTAHRSHPRIRGMLGLHASFTVDDATLEEVASVRPDGMGCHIHVAEDALDIDVSKRAYGATPVQRLKHHGLIDDRMLAIHCIHLESPDRRTLADAGAVVVHNPESNANNGVGRLDLESAADDGCTIGIGTDGMSSAMLDALRAAFLGIRGGTRDPRRGFKVVPELLAINAETAGRFLDEPLLGRLVPNAPADLCVLDAAPPTVVSADNVFAHLVYGSALTPVRHTIARGQVLLENHRFNTLDPLTIADEARRATPALWERFHALGSTKA